MQAYLPSLCNDKETYFSRLDALMCKALLWDKVVPPAPPSSILNSLAGSMMYFDGVSLYYVFAVTCDYHWWCSALYNERRRWHGRCGECHLEYHKCYYSWCHEYGKNVRCIWHSADTLAREKIELEE